MKPLIGQQLALLPEVAPYPISNPAYCANCPTYGQSCQSCQSCETVLRPSSPEHLLGTLYPVGQQILTLAVAESSPGYGQRPLSPEQAFAVGDEVRILAVQPHQSKVWVGNRGTVHRLSRTRVWVKLPVLNTSRTVELPFPVDCLERCPTLKRHPQRRHSPKGQASGWLEERQGNLKRKTPSISYYYGWLEEGVCRKRYVPVGKVHRVNDLIQQRRPVAEILAFLGVQEAQGDGANQ